MKRAARKHQEAREMENRRVKDKMRKSGTLWSEVKKSAFQSVSSLTLTV